MSVEIVEAVAYQRPATSSERLVQVEHIAQRDGERQQGVGTVVGACSLTRLALQVGKTLGAIHLIVVDMPRLHLAILEGVEAHILVRI